MRFLRFVLIATMLFPAAAHAAVLSRIDGINSLGIDLHRFQVWSPGAKVIIHHANGAIEKRDPPPMRFYRGVVNGDRDSFAFFAVDPVSGHIHGFVVEHNQRFEIHDHDLMAYSAADDIGHTWSCGVEHLNVTPSALRPTLHPRPQSISGTQQYSLSLVIETDYELFLAAGNDRTVLTNFVANLAGAVSTIYNRDIHTNVTVQALNIWDHNTGDYPWTATQDSAGLNQIGDYYHANFPNLKRSAVVLLSGKTGAGGVAWEGQICSADSLNGSDWMGAYAWCASMVVGPLVDPNAIVNGHLYGMPADYWDVEAVAHELGHVIGGHHTHCIALTPAEQAATGRAYVDTCYNQEAGCFSGTTSGGCDSSGYCAPPPPELGTIMSYCDLVQGSGTPQSRFTFGQPTEVSHHELDDYLLNPFGPGGTAGSPSDIFNVVTQSAGVTLSAIAAPAFVTPNSAANTASVSPIDGATYAWTITNGTITSGATTNAITFTAGALGNVTLNVAAYGTTGCGVSDSLAVAIQNAPGGTIRHRPVSPP